MIAFAFKYFREKLYRIVFVSSQFRVTAVVFDFMLKCTRTTSLRTSGNREQNGQQCV